MAPLDFFHMTEAELRWWVEDHPERVNDRDESGLTLIFWAACQSASLVIWLLDNKGADVNATISNGRTALHKAPTLDILNALLDRGADPTQQDSDGWTPLIVHTIIGNVDLVKRLLQDPRVRATVNAQDRWGRTALHLAGSASGRCSLRIVHLLLQAGANPAIIGHGGLTPLAWLRQHRPSDHATIALLEQAPDAEKAFVLVKICRLVVAAPSSTAKVPSYLQGRVAQGKPLPRVTLAPLTGGQNDEDEEECRKLHTMLAFVTRIGGEYMPRDVFRVVLEFLMPTWDPLRRRAVGTGEGVQD